MLHGKGDRGRTVGIDPGGMAIVQRWVEHRKGLGVSTRAPPFCTLKGKPLMPSYVETLLPRFAEKAGIEKRAHRMVCRHTMACELMREGVPMPVIQRQFGHASPATSDRYLAHLAPKDVVEAMQRREWMP